MPRLGQETGNATSLTPNQSLFTSLCVIKEEGQEIVHHGHSNKECQGAHYRRRENPNNSDMLDFSRLFSGDVTLQGPSVARTRARLWKFPKSDPGVLQYNPDFIQITSYSVPRNLKRPRRLFLAWLSTTTDLWNCHLAHTLSGPNSTSKKLFLSAPRSLSRSSACAQNLVRRPIYTRSG